MYFLTMRNISPLQQGIQSGHAAVEYMVKHGDLPETQEWAKFHKTFIILNGGTSGDMEKYPAFLDGLGVKYAIFREPDLNHSLSAIAFLVPESVYGIHSDDLETYQALRGIETQRPEYDFALFLKGFRLA